MCATLIAVLIFSPFEAAYVYVAWQSPRHRSSAKSLHSHSMNDLIAGLYLCKKNTHRYYMQNCCTVYGVQSAVCQFDVLQVIIQGREQLNR